MRSTFAFIESGNSLPLPTAARPDFSLRRKLARLSGPKGSVLTDGRSNTADALAGGGTFTAEKLNLHSRTNMEIIRYFLPVNFVTTQEGHLMKVEALKRNGTMNAQECVELRIQVQPSPETNDHEVQLLVDGKSLVDCFSSGLIGFDPDDLLTDPCPLRAENSSRPVIIGRCSCGIVGCGSVEVEIRRDHDHVMWMSMDSSQQVCFLLPNMMQRRVNQVMSPSLDVTWRPGLIASLAASISTALNMARILAQGWWYSARHGSGIWPLAKSRTACFGLSPPLQS